MSGCFHSSYLLMGNISICLAFRSEFTQMADLCGRMLPPEAMVLNFNTHTSTWAAQGSATPCHPSTEVCCLFSSLQVLPLSPPLSPPLSGPGVEKDELCSSFFPTSLSRSERKTRSRVSPYLKWKSLFLRKMKMGEKKVGRGRGQLSHSGMKTAFWKSVGTAHSPTFPNLERKKSGNEFP